MRAEAETPSPGADDASISKTALDVIALDAPYEHRPIRIGLPVLSVTLIGSTLRLRARIEIGLADMKGLTHQKPVS